MGQINVASDNLSAIPTFPGIDPTYAGVYVTVISDDAGTTATKNHLSFFNPVGSGKTVIVLGLTIGAYSVASVNSGVSLSVFKLTTPAPSAGTVITPSKFASTMPNSVADVRFSNPTVTTVNTNDLAAFPPPFGSAGVGASISAFQGASFAILPGEGVVFQAPSGNTNCRWNIEIVWGEK
jgi:hypothetical protein